MKRFITVLFSLICVCGYSLSTPAKFTGFKSMTPASKRYKCEAEVKLEGFELVFTFRCFQPKDTIQAAAKLHDRDVFKDDCVEFYIDKDGKGKDFQQYIVNPLGTIQDLSFRMKRWDSEGKTEGKITPQHWTAVLRVPLYEVAGNNEVEDGDVCIRINIGHSAPGKRYHESLLEHGVFSQMKQFLKLRLTGITPEKMREAYLAMLRSRGVDTAELEKLSGAKFYAAAGQAEKQTLGRKFKTLPEDVKYAWTYPTNVLPNAKFEYQNRAGEPVNWLKRGEGVCRYENGALTLKSSGKLELWQENQPILDNKRVYALRAKLRSVSGKNRFRINLTGADRSIRKLGMEKVVATLESPAFENSGKWQDFVYEFELPQSAFRADAGLIVENGEMQVKEVELDLLGKEDREIIVSMLGYHQKGYKDAIVWSRKGGLSPDFELVENGKTVYRGKAKLFPGNPYGRETYVADFSDFRGEGTFRLRSNGMTSNPFKVGAKVYSDGMRFMLNAYYYMRQGFAQPGWKKKPDYLDDAYIVSKEVSKKKHLLYLPDGRLNPKYVLGHKDVSGGWRDAGDDSKQGSDGESIYMLARILLRNQPDWNLRKGKMPDLPDELWWGCSRWAEKCYMGDGTFLDPTVNVTRRSPWVGRAPEDCTDGIPETPDDRIVFAVRSPDGKFQGSLHNQWRHMHSIGLTGVAMRKIDPEVARKCTEVMEAYYQRMKEKYQKEDLAKKKNWNRGDLGLTAGKLAYTAIYLHQLTGKAEYRETADRIMRKVIKLVNTGDYQHFDYASSFHATLHYYNVMLEYAEFYPDTKLLPELKKAIRLYIDKMVLPGFDRDSLFPVFQQGRLIAHYGKESDKSVRHYGVTYMHSLAALTLLRAGRILGDAQYEVLADKGLQYWMGRNPQNLSEVCGLGWRYTALMTGLSFCEGHDDAVIPGIMANGFRALDFMPIPAKPSAVKPGGTLATLYGVEAWIQATGMGMGLMGELDRIYAGKP